jgi:hypothetical protein
VTLHPKPPFETFPVWKASSTAASKLSIHSKRRLFLGAFLSLKVERLIWNVEFWSGRTA